MSKYFEGIGARTKVYIAAPYSAGDIGENVNRAIICGDFLSNYGFVPYIPHLNHLWHTVLPREYEFWLAYDMEWLKSCDVLVRLEGQSKGADLEVDFAIRTGMMVFYNTTDLLLYYQKLQDWKLEGVVSDK